ncbi:MAG: hypothetical protein J7K73_04215 [Nanoarchaeota archaeon]|nr:hypothetical protein [Nanoarchaeota archaeon]
MATDLEEKLDKYGVDGLADALFNIYNKSPEEERIINLIGAYARDARKLYDEDPSKFDIARFVINMYYILDDYDSIRDVVAKMKETGIPEPEVLHMDDEGAETVARIIKEVYHPVVKKVKVKKKRINLKIS